jgi:hypothetical protein
MAKGNCIVVSADPYGRFFEGIISGTPKPGTMMEIVPATAAVNGRFTWRVFSGASGAAQLCAILLEDALQGKTATDAYVTATQGRMYCPLPGDHMNILVADVAGTADDRAIGDIMMVQTGTGKFIADSSGARKPFMLLEAATDPTADALMWAMATGV